MTENVFPGKWFLVQMWKETMFWHEWKIPASISRAQYGKFSQSHLKQAFLPIKSVIKTMRWELSLLKRLFWCLKSLVTFDVLLLIIMYVVVKFRITIIIYIYMMLILQKANGKVDTKECRLKFIH